MLLFQRQHQQSMHISKKYNTRVFSVKIVDGFSQFSHDARFEL